MLPSLNQKTRWRSRLGSEKGENEVGRGELSCSGEDHARFEGQILVVSSTDMVGSKRWWSQVRSAVTGLTRRITLCDNNIT